MPSYTFILLCHHIRSYCLKKSILNLRVSFKNFSALHQNMIQEMLQIFFFFLSSVILRGTYSLHISKWYHIEAQVTKSAVTIPHPLHDKPARVEVQVKVQENGSEVIFPASGSAQRDDDSYNIYGGVVYFYNKHHVKIFVPRRAGDSDTGVIIYSGKHPMKRKQKFHK